MKKIIILIIIGLIVLLLITNVVALTCEEIVEEQNYLQNKMQKGNSAKRHIRLEQQWYNLDFQRYNECSQPPIDDGGLGGGAW